ncbi:MAG: peptide chain release factor N(5)-glutamine methyltransferase [Chitinophagaceae bacterium]
MTIKEATVYSTDHLKTIYEEGEASTISDWVMENLAGIKKTDRINYSKKVLEEDQVELLNSWLGRLLENEPVQYVLNEAWFCGLKFYVDKNVLIPRPETEELVEWIITGCKFPIDELKILDIGSGSGCIPIALKRRLGKAEVWSCDISKEALEVAEKNAKTLGADVNFIHTDFLQADQRNKFPSFDIIVSNPPYITHKERYNMRANVLEYEPAKALFVPDADPLLFYKAIAGFGKDHLNANGTIYMEINESFEQEVSELFQKEGYQTEIKKDMQGKDRMVSAKF